MIALAFFSGMYRNWLGIGAEGRLGFWTSGVEILLTAVTSFLVVALFSVCIRSIPKAGRWIIG